VAVKPFRVAVLTLALVPELVEGPPRPLSAFTPQPQRVTFSYGARADRLDLYLPGASPADLREPDRHPTLMLVLGVGALALDDERVVRFANALARLGFVVAAPGSVDMSAGRLTPDEPAHLVEAFEAVAAHPAVDPDRISIAAFSAGAGIALLAAVDPRIADRVVLINAFGSFGAVGELLAEFASRSMVVDGETLRWQPRPFAREVFLGIVLERITDPALRELVRVRIGPLVLSDAGPGPGARDPIVEALLEGDAAAAYRLLTSGSIGEARAVLASFSDAARADLAALSPVGRMGALRTRVFLMHDTADDVIPFSQLAPLAAAIPPDRLAKVSTFSFFDHITPRGLEPAALPDLWGFYLHLVEVMHVAL
jgi:hypothetical protein